MRAFSAKAAGSSLVGVCGGFEARVEEGEGAPEGIWVGNGLAVGD